MNPELVKQAILKEETSFIKDKIDNADINQYFSFENSIINAENTLFTLSYFLICLTFTFPVIFLELSLLDFIPGLNGLSLVPSIFLILTLVLTSFVLSWGMGCKALKSFYKRKFSRANDEEKFNLYKRMYGNSFYHQAVNDDIKSLLKLSLNNEEYYQLATANKHIDYIHALDAINEKIKKEDILSEKMEVSLDLNKMKQYNIEIVNS